MAKDEQYGISEWGRNVGNFISGASPYSTANKNALKRDLGNVGAFFTSTKAKTTPKYSNNRNGAVGSADAMERRAKAAKAGKNSFGKSQGPIAGGQDQGETFEEMLARIMGAGGGGGGGGGSRRAYSDEQVAATSAKLQALYNRYAADVAAREADIAGYYDKSAANLGGIYDTSASNVAKAYEAARAAQTQQLQALGLTEHTPVSQFGNETAAITSLNNLRAAVLAQNEASKGRAITNQRLASEAAQREGAQVAAKAAQAMAAEMVSTGGGGGGGGGGGLSPYQYASLLLQNKKNEDTAAYNAAKVASSQKSQPSVQAALDAAANWKGTPDQLRAFEAFYGKV